LDDASSIADVHVRSWKSAYDGLIPADYLDNLSTKQREPMWRQILSQTLWPAKGGLVLVDEGAVVGFAWVCPSRDDGVPDEVGELGAIYLVSEVWGRGGGRLLMQEAVRRLSEAGFKRATLWVLRSNSRARRFYEAAGWAPDGAEKIEERPGLPLDEVRYGRGL
jgi:GNAT superfamily N-acetyltransferase